MVNDVSVNNAADDDFSENAGNEFSCFDGDTSDMPVAARRVAIVLKQGRPIMGGSADGAFSKLLEHRAAIKLSLNNDLLGLWLDEENEVAWAEEPIDSMQSSLLTKPTLRRNDANVFIALAGVVIQDRRLGFERTTEWFVTRDEIEARYLALDKSSAVDTRGNKVAGEIDRAIRLARERHWLSKADEDRWQILPTVASLIDRGFLDELIERLSAADAALSDPPQEDPEDNND